MGTGNTRTNCGVTETGTWVREGAKSTFVPDKPSTTVSVKDDPNSTKRTITYTTTSSSGKTVVTITIPDRYNPDKHPMAMKVTSTQNGKTTSYTYEDVRGLISVSSAPKVDAKTGVAVEPWYDSLIVGLNVVMTLNELKQNAALGFAHGLVEYAFFDAADLLLNALNLNNYTGNHITSTYDDLIKKLITNESAYYVGRALADGVIIALGAAGLVGGAFIAAAGVAGTGASFVLDATGIGAIIGIPAGVVSLAIVGAGVAVGGAGALIAMAAGNNFSGNVGKAVSGNSDNPQNPKKVDDKYLTQHGVDSHDLKYDTIGKSADVSKYDIFVDKNGDLWIQQKGSSAWIPTYESIVK